MKRLLLGLMLALCAANTAYAADKPPSEASIRKLLEVTDARKLLDSMWQHVDASIDTTIEQVLADRELTDEQRKILDDMQAKMFVVFREEMSWEFMESMMLEVYAKSFTQQEVDGMLEFYATPAGRSLITKMPVVMQHTMQAVQQRMTTLMPRLQQVQKDALAQVKAAK